MYVKPQMSVSSSEYLICFYFPVLAAALWRPRTIQSASIFTATSEGHKGLIHDEDVKSLVARWDKYNKMWYGPDRDFKNFPSLRIPDHKPAVRLGFIPSTWFDAFYEKTGATGEIFKHVYLICKKLCRGSCNSVET